MDHLKILVTRRLEEGDFRGAVRIASSASGIAKPSSATLQALCDKHPPSPSDFDPPPPPVDIGSVDVCESEVASAIASFPCGSSGGPDGLRPQHLKDMSSVESLEFHHSPLLSALASFSSLVMEGRVPESVRPFFFGARLIALDKKGGGVRPIAIGCCLRRLVAKIACNRVSADLSSYFSPLQLGFGVKGGVEAAVHAARRFLDSLSDSEALVKLDFSNAFNSLRCDRILDSVRDLCPDIFPLVSSAYRFPSSLFWENEVLSSAEGVQQGTLWVRSYFV
jgi:hypothetical protein